jgi:hypothetical protein
MKRALPVTTLFLDVGGVLLTNGWDHLARKRTARNFNLNWAEMDERRAFVETRIGPWMVHEGTSGAVYIPVRHHGGKMGDVPLSPHFTLNDCSADPSHAALQDANPRPASKLLQ